MPSSSESRRRRKDHDRDDRDSPRHRERPKLSARTSRKHSSASAKDKDREKEWVREKDRDEDHDMERDRPATMHSTRRRPQIVPEMERRSSADLRPSNYPPHSKAHSREVVGSRESLVNPRLSLYTPDPTIVDSEAKAKLQTTAATGVGAAPPSPPLTAEDADLRRTRSGHSIRTPAQSAKRDIRARPTSYDGSRSSPLNSRRTPSKSTSDLRKSVADDSHISPIQQGKSKRGEDITESEFEIASEAQSYSPLTEVKTAFTNDSQATSRPRAQNASRTTPSPQTIYDASPKTPTGIEPLQSSAKDEVIVTSLHSPFGLGTSPEPSPADLEAGFAKLTTPPPPPPPPVPDNAQAPRVDYLLQNGGLPTIAPRGLFGSVTPSIPPSGQPLSSPSFAAFVRSRQNDALKVFAPFDKILDSYLQVVSRNGSLAVATGYRSVARRLLDRLETVFNRNISSETCSCIMCISQNSKHATEKERGVSWGEVLEYVSGRKDLPPWPPFSISSDAPDLPGGLDAPMQKMDVDVPDEYRDHYIRQSNNTKQVVQAWLASQEEVPSSPPQEVDDETLIFAMSTRLDVEKRRLFTALLRGMNTLPASRTATPQVKVRSELIARTAVALQRLYRLVSSPRDAECSLFLLQNAELHGVLATLAAISEHEWEILVSGRFDGFLWSGADGPPDRTQSPKGGRSASRGSTPFSGVSKSSTPGLGVPRRASETTALGSGAPVQMDEETEIAVLAELEREIYAGMDALEDAFEALHTKAETVRAALRSRGAGLSMTSISRRGSNIATVSVSECGAEPSLVSRPPSSSLWDGLLDNGVDLRSELAPDDSASNVSRNRRRKRTTDRRELRTPMTVEEEEDEDDHVRLEEGRKK